MLSALAISGYRSLRDVVLPLDRLNVVTGPNGSGKSSLYRSIRLLADVAQGRIVASLAAEGGLSSTLWAGPEAFSQGMKRGEVAIRGTARKERVSLKLGFAGEDYGYAIDLGLPPPLRSAFDRDPEIKAEAVWTGEVLARNSLFASRRGPSVTVLDDQGQRRLISAQMAPFDSMMTHAADPRGAPELLVLRERMRAWRFYDHLRSDARAPARRPQVGTRTPALAADGGDLAAALQTIVEIGDHEALLDAVSDAFPGADIEIAVSADGLFELTMHQRGLLRALRAAELSDGTLRYLCLVAALLSPRPPGLLVLNEPEASLHPDLLAPLARLIADAATRSQLIVVTHAAALVSALAAHERCELLALDKQLGETVLEAHERPRWTWPKR
ncbi:AAA family ATPase [Haliangium ochraceum]|uniref:SMC domain protein n=1 Tax=Haliangium ochraceum (strain DSM 14365 / JCM 11303 / SMP-2) TaxID=502025 RepID=D0LWZ4_HALO1|nr:AAA family ATPase [Haliangium ochraceum]ACY14241.1 SMC domain protein [Haliangium ochraceum DSM 14365]